MFNRQFLKNAIIYGSIYFTFISLAILIIASMVENGSEINPCISCGFPLNSLPLLPRQCLSLFLFSMLMGVGSSLYRCECINLIVRVWLHAICYILGFFIFFILCCGYLQQEQVLTYTAIATILFSIVYTIITVISRAAARSFKKAQNVPKTEAKQVKKAKRNQEYQSQFTKNT